MGLRGNGRATGHIHAIAEGAELQPSGEKTQGCVL